MVRDRRSRRPRGRPVPGPRGQRRPRRGSVYLLTLAVTLAVTLIGLASVTVERIRIHAAISMVDAGEADRLAFAAVEHALTALDNDPAWRSTYTHGATVGPVALGPGTTEWKLLDMTGDELLDNGDTDPVRVVGIGRAGGAARHYSVLLEESGATPLEVLGTVAHSDAGMNVTGSVVAAGGPISTNGALANSNTITGSVDAASISGGGTVSGTTNVPAPPKPMPSATTFDLYFAQGTPIAFSSVPGGIIQRVLLSAAANPYGPTDADGVYTIQVPPGATLTVAASRLEATLVVALGANATLAVSGAVLWEPVRPDLPVLLVRAAGAATIDLNGFNNPLRESTTAVNFNPPGTPYLGEEDGDLLDEYPTEIRGLVHIIGDGAFVTLGSNFEVVGTIITDGPMSLGSNTSLTTEPRLLTQTPAGYEGGGPMKAVAGSWRRVVPSP